MATNRGQESPMDFQWENSHGPVAADSPWRLNNFRPTFPEETPSRTRVASDTCASPPKNPFITPSKPRAFPNPQNCRTGYALPKQMFPTPGRSEPTKRAEYSEVRSSGDDMDTDNEAPTPDPHLNHILHRNPRTIARALQHSPTRITGRGEIRRGRDDDRISKDHRSLRHRRQRSRRSYDYSEDDESDDSDDYDTRRSRSPRKHRARSRPRLLLEDPAFHLGSTGAGGWRPKDISDWIQILFNVGVLGAFIFYGCAFIWTVQADVRNKVEAEASSVIQRIGQCQRDYLTNRCSPNQRVPAMEETCNRWELCMNADPQKVGWAKVGAVTLAEIFNGFAHTLTYKSMMFFFILVFGVLLVANAAFSLYRTWTESQQRPYIPVPVPQFGNEWMPQSADITGTSWTTPTAKPGPRMTWFSPATVDGKVGKKLEWN